MNDLKQRFGDAVLPLALDVTQSNQVQQVVQQAYTHFGKLDVLVNNAGVALLAATEEASDDQIRELFDTNYIGMVRVLRAALPLLRQQGGGHILGVSSGLRIGAMPLIGFYSATKWAVEGLHEALAEEVKALRVFITGCLGGVGRIATQISRMRDAEIAGSCSVSRRDEALALGVREVFDYRTFNANTYRGRFDVVFDTHGALSLSQCNAMLKRGGVALHIVPTPLKMIRSMFSSGHETVFARLTPQSMAGIVEAVEQGKLAPTIGRTVPLSEAIPAIIELEKTNSFPGKLVVIPNQPGLLGGNDVAWRSPTPYAQPLFSDETSSQEVKRHQN